METIVAVIVLIFVTDYFRTSYKNRIIRAKLSDLKMLRESYCKNRLVFFTQKDNATSVEAMKAFKKYIKQVEKDYTDAMYDIGYVDIEYREPGYGSFGNYRNGEDIWHKTKASEIYKIILNLEDKLKKSKVEDSEFYRSLKEDGDYSFCAGPGRTEWLELCIKDARNTLIDSLNISLSKDRYIDSLAIEDYIKKIENYIYFRIDRAEMLENTYKKFTKADRAKRFKIALSILCYFWDILDNHTKQEIQDILVYEALYLCVKSAIENDYTIRTIEDFLEDYKFEKNCKLDLKNNSMVKEFDMLYQLFQH